MLGAATALTRQLKAVKQRVTQGNLASTSRTAARSAAQLVTVATPNMAGQTRTLKTDVGVGSVQNSLFFCECSFSPSPAGVFA
jgi:hypothetical protein